MIRIESFLLSLSMSESSKTPINEILTLSHYSNAIGPLIAIWMIYTDGSVLQKSESPLLLLLYGGLGMCVGLWILGQRVNDTIGKNITEITPTT